MMNAEIKKNIETYAIIDLETSNLPQYGKANITELSIVTISKSDLQKNSLERARVQNKLTLLFNPQTAIHPDAGELSALSNDILEHENTFNENSANAIIHFIEHLKLPCLVAHNGNRFDFPILKKQFDSIKKDLPDDLLCVDSFPAIRCLDSQLVELQNVLVDEPVNVEPVTLKVENDEYTTLLSDGCDHLFQKLDMERIIKNNETTPKRRPEDRLQCGQNKKRDDILGNHEEKFSKPLKTNARRSLFQAKTELKSKPGDYKLSNIYKRLFKEEPLVIHQAESDVLILQKVLQHYGGSFVDYSEINAKPFKDVSSNSKRNV